MQQIIDFLRTDGTDNIIQLMLFIFGAIGWIIVAIINQSSRKKDKRLSVYNDVLEKFEIINQSFMENFAVSLSTSMLNFQKSIIQDPVQTTKYLFNFMEENQKYLEQSMKLVANVFIQFAKFRLVASAKTIGIFEEYKNKSNALINEIYASSQGVMQQIGNLEEVKEAYSNIDKKIKDKAISLKSLYQQLEQQMKKDIGF